MTQPPPYPKIYHITHLDNLPAIIAEGNLLSDAAMIAKGGPTTAIGMNTIKKRRLSLPVKCHAALNVGNCVPFYFCPRSIMLYLIHKGNHNELSFHGGQMQIVHLESDLNEVIQWASSVKVRWAFSTSNAAAKYANFYNCLSHIGEVDWNAVASNSFSNDSLTPSGLQVGEGKQAEFLVENDFPWTLVKRIGAASQIAAKNASNKIASSSHRHKPAASHEPTWYF
jgi:ssDNA thymidine ADP-ribosyltransferase, DarT